jgi:Fur family peroxide stress response transcriptional regulator
MDDLVRMLRERGQRLTPQRAAIISRFLSRSDHPSAEQLHEDLLAEYPMMALSTVYDTLRLLVDLGEAVDVSPACAQARFDPRTDDHCHLVCLKCKGISDVPLRRQRTQADVATCTAGTGFRPVRHILEVFGYCQECQRG